MAYDPADLRLPPWLLRLLDALVRLRLPLGRGWHLGLTRPGAMFAASMLGVTVAALYSGNNLLYLCAAMLLSLGGLALIACVVLLRCVPDLSCFMPDVSTANGVHVLRRVIAARSRFPAFVHARWEGGDSAADLRIRFAEDAVLQARLCVPGRGLMHFPVLILSSEAPLGLWHLSRRIESAAWTWAVVPTAAALQASMQSHAPEGGEWNDIRAYARGDAPARIHWRKSAYPSASDWVVKCFAGQDSMKTDELLRVDLRGPAGPDFELLLARVAGWMRRRTDGCLILGQTKFNLNETGGRRQAWRALAAAAPETSPPAGDGGMLLHARNDHAVR
ncbi:MAG: DUF58 domain-containing protein [Mariprofundaceae bacterium]|nr:DUF58 domain-containing protein [Mariprofundaceae bacterium]